jgi:cell division protein FtsA
MNQNAEYVTAIDIGTTKIVAIVGKKDRNGKLKILGLGTAKSTGVKRGVVSNVEETGSGIQQAVQIAEKESGVKFRDVYVGIAGQHIKSLRNRGYRHITNPEMEITADDVKALTEDMYKIPIEAGEEIIHVIPQSYAVDNETGVKNPVGMFGKRIEGNFHVVVGQIFSARNLNKCIERGGMKINKLILEPLASSTAVLTEDEKEAGVALIDIGGGTTDVAVYYDGIIRHTAVIPFGGNAVTSDIRKGCSILSRYAEALKVQYGSALSDLASKNKVVTIPGISGRDSKEISFHILANIIQARMEEIIEAIMYEIENSGFANQLGAGLALTGGGAMLRHLSELVKFRTGLDVRLGYPDNDLAKGYNDNVNNPVFSTGIGLIIKGFEDMENRIKKQESLPEEPEEEEEDISEQEKEPKKDGKFIDTLRTTLRDIFDEKDTDM